MKLKRFTKYASRAESLTSQVPKDIIQAIKKLSVEELKSIFKDFVPLDFVALVQHHNEKVFTYAIQDMLNEVLESNSFRVQIEIMRLNRDDLRQEIFATMANSDPRKQGILSQIKQQGSSSHSFEYTSKDQPSIRLHLKSSVAPIESGNAIQVPHCPIDQRLGIKSPLWFLEVEDGRLVFAFSLDKNNRCVQKEPLSEIGKMSEEEFIIFKNLDAEEKLTKQQIQQINSGARTLEYSESEEEAFLQCTFHTKLNKFKSFLYTQALAVSTKLMAAHRKRNGLTITSKEFKQLAAFQQKVSDKTITEEEKIEFEDLKKRLTEKAANELKTTQLDQPKDGDDENPSPKNVTYTFDPNAEEATEALFELRRKLPQHLEDQLESFLEIIHTVPIHSVLKLLQQAYFGKDPKQEQLLNQIPYETQKIAQAYLGISKDKGQLFKCKTCLAPSIRTSNCPFAREMRLNIVRFYKAAETFKDFSSKLKSLDEKAKKHYEQSNLEPILNQAYTGLEIHELDLAFEEQQSKLSPDKLETQFYTDLSTNQKKAFEGTDLEKQEEEEEEVNEEEIEKIEEISTLLQSFLHAIFTTAVKERKKHSIDGELEHKELEHKSLDEYLKIYLIYNGAVDVQ
jgi:hypothetical protein